MPVPEERQRLAYIGHVRAEPQVADLPDTSAWMLDYNAQFRADLPEGGDWIWKHLPKNGPPGWAVHTRACDGYVCLHDDSGMIAQVDGRREADGRDWLHLYLNHPARFLFALELLAAKEDFFGTRAEVLIVLPSARLANPAKWGVDHLFWCPAAPGLVPNFARIATDRGPILRDMR